MNVRRWWLVAACVMLCLGTAKADILIGQTVGVTGTVAATVKESMLGAQLYIDDVNAKGGILGEKINVITLDDQFDTSLTLANGQTLIEKNQVVALFMSRGTPHTQGLIALLDKHGVPMIGPSTGAMVLHQPVQKHIFNVRAPYQREAEKVISHLALTGFQRIALVAVDDTFGADALIGAENGLAHSKLQAVTVARFDRSKPDFSSIAANVIKTQAQAVLVIGSGTAVVSGIQTMRAAGSKAQFITLSNNASEGFIKLLGNDARGVIVTQVFPNSLNYGLVRDAEQLARAKGVMRVSPSMLEGYASAKVLVEGLRQVGKRPTRAKLQAALESLQLDLGGLTVNYNAKSHTGLEFADLSIITEDGKFRR